MYDYSHYGRSLTSIPSTEVFMTTTIMVDLYNVNTLG
jgi:hypothetical protein